MRNHETAVMKVNDAYGNPIELAAVVVWRVEDTAQAKFEVEDFQEFVATQTEAAVRHIAIEYPYDAHDEDAPVAARQRRGDHREARDRTARAGAGGGRAHHRVALHPSRLRPPRSPPPCSSGSRPARWSPPAS
ncbi:hypothetical protein GCM10020000_29240 [Streptomyces olivoverticillatus]